MPCVILWDPSHLENGQRNTDLAVLSSASEVATHRPRFGLVRCSRPEQDSIWALVEDCYTSGYHDGDLRYIGGFPHDGSLASFP